MSEYQTVIGEGIVKALMESLQLDEKEVKKRINKALDLFDENKRSILIYRFVGPRAHTLEEVSEKYSISREEIRQIEAVFLRKIRHPYRSRKLSDYLD